MSTYVSTDIIKIINKYLPKVFYGGFILTRYSTKPFQDDIKELIVFDIDKYKILEEIKTYCIKKIQWERCVHGRNYIIIGVCIKQIELGKIISNVDWNDCQGYFDNTFELDRNIHLERIN
jgi:hypothetical protein